MLRASYLWDFARLLHMDANQIDKLRLIDFFQYCLNVDEYRKQQKKAAEEGRELQD